ncbi:MAG: methyltransferase [Prevotellaceae bacterium]|jgi:tRNA1Val (adenine37-N6)-methyltransferase|nr:methyltransferase [Prevotellaceae bacterium]
MPNPYFQFKQFTVWHHRTAMKVGTDGVLLGAWADVKNAQAILDIGTGTGLIALMLAQRSDAVIDAIEIEKNAYGQACENVGASLWQDRMNVIHTSLQDFKPQKNYDLIVSNPPYFVQSLKNPSQEKTLARHNDTLSQEDLLIFAAKYLSENGRLAVILPVEQGRTMQEGANNYSLFCNRVTRVIPCVSASEKRLLLEFSRKNEPYIETELQIETDRRHEYSEDFKQLTQDFYLKH